MEGASALCWALIAQRLDSKVAADRKAFMALMLTCRQLHDNLAFEMPMWWLLDKEKHLDIVNENPFVNKRSHRPSACLPFPIVDPPPPSLHHRFLVYSWLGFWWNACTPLPRDLPLPSPGTAYFSSVCIHFASLQALSLWPRDQPLPASCIIEILLATQEDADQLALLQHQLLKATRIVKLVLGLTPAFVRSQFG